jgi:hypothetical protein
LDELCSNMVAEGGIDSANGTDTDQGRGAGKDRG